MQWEYTTVYTDTRGDLVARNFALLGERGWELVSVSGNTAYFKRPKQADDPQS